MLKVLIVDDNEKLRSIFKLILKEYQIFEAKNGIEAIKVFKEKQPNIILMDILMPEMDGITATKEILIIDPKTVIIAITAYSSRASEILKAGAKEVLTKPIRNKELLNKIKDYCQA